ncbi:hypothetical protein [Chamaesiphon sp.]|uniref:hypothetical protein n=1 Tax=Chamaesiphon sp. TaxID=2814140 RepID=UPI0035942045
MFAVSYNSFNLTRLGIQEHKIITAICNDRVSDKARGDVQIHLPSFREFVVKLISFNKIYMSAILARKFYCYLPKGRT